MNTQIHDQHAVTSDTLHQTYENQTNFETPQTAMVFGGTGGSGTTTLVNHLQLIGIRAFEPQCRCQVNSLLASDQNNLPQTKIVVVNSSYVGASKAAELTAQHQIHLVAVVRETPLTIPFSTKLKLRALTGRADVVIFPHVWQWHKGNLNRQSKKYHRSLTLLANRIHYHTNRTYN